MSGEAAGYYNGGYEQPQAQPPPQPEYAAPDSKKEEYPPQYTAGAPPPSYEEVFKIEKPKFNDIWAGLLVGVFRHMRPELF